jgi:membrane-bound inhibitor of C-type lysozyme
MRLRPALALPFCLLAAPAAAQDVGPAFSASYACPDGVVVQAAYINPDSGPSYAVIGWEGRLIPMQAGPTGSGARYVEFGEAGGYIWWTKGPEATLLYVDPEDMDTERTVLAGCQQIGG